MPREDAILTSATLRSQVEVEELIEPKLAAYLDGEHRFILRYPEFTRAAHLAFVRRGTEQGFGDYMLSLDASLPWLVYWTLQSMAILGSPLTPTLIKEATEILRRCQGKGGGFGGMKTVDSAGSCFEGSAHLATTFAAVCSIALLGTPDAYSLVADGAARAQLLYWIVSLQVKDALGAPTGPFAVHEQGGEADLRGVYCVVAIGYMLRWRQEEWERVLGGWGAEARTLQWIRACQTWEGGLAGVPLAEAHGGYAFCGVAALAMLDQLSLLDIPSLLTWVTSRQMALEGGCQGRVHKLVDGCYSYWIGGLFPILERHLGLVEVAATHVDHAEPVQRALFDPDRLLLYLLACCQHEAALGGGLLDKPEKYPDLYHTCYDLAGASIALSHIRHGQKTYVHPALTPKLHLAEIDIFVNVVKHKLDGMRDYFDPDFEDE